MGTHVRIK